MIKALVILSGGQDSTTCLYWALDHGFDVAAITFDYGQKHKEEIVAAQRVAQLAGIAHKHMVVELGLGILRGSSPLVNASEQLEQYADHRSLPGGLEKTFVPMRNQLFLTVAANRAYVRGINRLVTGVCEEDYGGYPDCRRVFIDAFEACSSLGTFTGEPETLPRLVVDTPLMDITKKQTVQMAMRFPGCYQALAWTHTAYDGQYPPKGKDHASLLRAKGFEEAMIPDPLVLRAVKDGLMELPITPNYSGDIERFYKLAKLV